MNSSLPTNLSEDRSLSLPACGNTVAAEDLKVRLVLAADLDDEIRIDASQVESVGQCVLQLLVAARAEADDKALEFEITNPSAAFVERVSGCGLAETLGLEIGKDHP
ncbi:STAS domain-containing protein [Novosphingobium sp. RD2P27]|uniref:STAS domain-containing protein n=1 Tax=Novosphingobium kalidii TaxID=3230299 RepID=A0ABV2CY30_9SPHN